MFKIPATPGSGTPEQAFHSFEETAKILGANVGDLRREMQQMRSRVHDADAKLDKVSGRMVGSRSSFPVNVATVSAPPLHGFQAVNVSDYERLCAACGVKPTLTSPDGFPDIVRRDQLQKALGLGGVALQELIDKLRVAEVRIECLTKVGYEYATTKLAWLKEEKPPAGLDAVGVGKWRDDRKHAALSDAVAEAAKPTKARAPRRVEA